jgi:hypothetical protein
MIDFLMISTRNPRKEFVEIYPKFIIKKSSDLMIRGGDFYAIWVEEKGLWSTDEQDVIKIVDYELDEYVRKNKSSFEGSVRVMHMWDSSSGMIDIWHKYCQRQMRDYYHMLDERLIFSNQKTKKEDYASKTLNYPLEKGNLTAYNRLISTLYSDEERMKIEWAIGAVVCGKSKDIQKFMVFYGEPKSGKSTILNIIQKLFDGYYTTFDAKVLGSSTNSFALEAFRTNPLVAIQHDGDMSKIEDNTRINSLVSHELMSVNEKWKSAYTNKFNSFLFIGSNKPVKITDAKSGLIRRLIDISPSGNRLSREEYDVIIKQVDFELGAIAYHCKNVYSNNEHKYDEYVPIVMLGASNNFYNFICDYYHTFQKENGTTLKSAWEMYKTYCDEAKVSYPFSKMIFKEELKNYFNDYKERFVFDDGSRVRNYYFGFKSDKFEEPEISKTTSDIWINFNSISSLFDIYCSDCDAQYANEKGTPYKKWADVSTTLKDIDTTALHYVKLPENHIIIDFDICDETGNKSLEKNIEAANKFPKTYAEISKSGFGIHLHYIYTGDVSKLSTLISEYVEVKVFSGNSSLRRKLTKCNDIPIATINSGLPMKGDDKVTNFDNVKNEKGIRTLIRKNLNKEIHPGTKPSIDFIYKILKDAYNENTPYDVLDMRNSVLAFAASSTNQADYCIKLVNKMKFKSEKTSEDIYEGDDGKLVFYDVEIFPNLFLVNWKVEGEDKPIVRMINPKPVDIEKLLHFKLVGFNCRRYDNHMLYARLMGYTNEQLFNLSQKIISGNDNCFFGEAYNLSYTDVYDFSSKKQSLKKFEIELGIHHQELGLPWDKPVPEELWTKVAEYCDNDVIATEAVFNARKSDFLARQILVDVAGMSVNSTTNSLSTRIIFGDNRKPQDQFNYRDMSCDPGKFNNPVFTGYKFKNGKSTYRGEEVGEGGYVYAEPGVYGNVALLDIASMHPSSIVAEKLFGDKYTKRFKDILDARLAIKHGDFDKAKTMLGGILSKYLTDETAAKDLSTALKIVINSIYGLTSARFDNPFRDKRNIDNIVAKRGSLFMIDLKHEVQNRGFTVAHIKTDSIKIPDATPEIIDFVMEFGKKYGYTFEHEATYDKMCLVNDAVYIAIKREKDGSLGKWTATGTQFQVPYVFKSLFSKEDIGFDDLCETKSVTSALYLDMNESIPDGHDYKFIGKVGRFCPIKEGCGGGILLRETLNKNTGEKGYAAATGTKGYRWLESEIVKDDYKNLIDISYFTKMKDDAMSAISSYCDLDWFCSDIPYSKEENRIPF